MAGAHTEQEMLNQVRKIVPPLLPKFHKGQLGRVLVVGGSEDYTGAPYFAATASALVGADMSHILCTGSAAPVIKSYSPNLMVHPYLHDENNKSQLSSKIAPLLERMHVVLIGPGLGRDDDVLNQVSQIIELCAERNLPLVVDADGLFLIQKQPSLISNYHKHRAILTPNVVEFGRLLKSTGIENDDTVSAAKALAQKLGCAILVKGESDTITDGVQVLNGSEQGSNRRVSGQGDTLSGSLATFVAWTEAYKSKLWDAEPVDEDLLLLAGLGASSVTRRASKLAYERHGRAMVTTDVNTLVGESFAQLFEKS